jgi:hypothetical protein
MIIIASLFLGVVTGIAATLQFAMWYAAKPATQAKPQHSISATSVSLNRDTATTDHDKMLEGVLRQAGHGKLWEIFQTRH